MACKELVPRGMALQPPTVQFRTVRDRSVLADLVDLTKPRIVGLLVFTGAASAVVAAGGWPGLRPLATVAIGGGLAGSFPPLVGWAAVTGRVGATALALAAVIFLWTPPHFWALATLAGDQYREAGIPMLPAVAGSHRTARVMLVYAGATVAVS